MRNIQRLLQPPKLRSKVRARHAGSRALSSNELDLAAF